eukprot:7787-Heterococcus_DN1.PRE.2
MHAKHFLLLASLLSKCPLRIPPAHVNAWHSTHTPFARHASYVHVSQPKLDPFGERALTSAN